jgi:hypothetical protein
MIIERQVQKVLPGKWPAYESVDKKMDALIGRLGFPAKKLYRCIMGGHDFINTLIMERQWESLAAMEAAYGKILVNPEYQALEAELFTVIESGQIEVYRPLP